MKKLILFIVSCLFLVTLGACHRGLKSAKGVVKSMNDTSIVATVDDEDAFFVVTKAKFVNGAVNIGDTIDVDYSGSLSDDNVQAHVIRVIPKKPQYIETKYNPNAKLESVPMTSDQEKSLDQFVKDSKKRGH